MVGEMVRYISRKEIVRKRTYSLAALLLVAGCGYVNHDAERKQMVDEQKACHARFPAVVGEYRRLATCLDTAELEFASKVPNAYDEANDRAQARDIIARKIDTKEISVEDGKAEMKKEFLSISGSHRAQAAEAEDDRRQRAAAFMLRSGAFRSQPVYQAPAPSIYSPNTTNCTSFVSGQYINTNCSH